MASGIRLARLDEVGTANSTRSVVGGVSPDVDEAAI